MNAKQKNRWNISQIKSQTVIVLRNLKNTKNIYKHFSVPIYWITYIIIIIL